MLSQNKMAYLPSASMMNIDCQLDRFQNNVRDEPGTSGPACEGVSRLGLHEEDTL